MKKLCAILAIILVFAMLLPACSSDEGGSADTPDPGQTGSGENSGPETMRRMRCIPAH